MLYGSFLALDPMLLSVAYDVLFDAATISSNPTERGLERIDGSSRVFGLHRLRRKPLSSLSEDAFLALEEGRHDGLLQYQIDLRQGLDELQTQLQQLLVVESSLYSEFQRKAVSECCEQVERQARIWLQQVSNRFAYNCRMHERLLPIKSRTRRERHSLALCIVEV